ncbi:hypothetical protein SDC9_191856 [bioreactor metagenome]|uniref:Uncharacterized protein n=1 Tax=bioreactor metagenome TaxID=1076179 RepID=A0A645I7B6_9ZZZZ
MGLLEKSGERHGGHAVEAGVVGEAGIDQQLHVAGGVVPGKGGAQVTVFAGGEHGAGALGPLHLGGKQTLPLAPLQATAVKPAGRRRGLAVFFGEEGLVLVVDDEFGGAGGCRSDQPAGDLGVDVPAVQPLGPARSVSRAKAPGRQ